jgi:hypothetical protein
VPIAPALPNGIGGLASVQPSSSPTSQGKRPGVHHSYANLHTSFNTVFCLPEGPIARGCVCKNVSSCTCRSSPSTAESPAGCEDPPQPQNGLAALARAAAMCRSPIQHSSIRSVAHTTPTRTTDAFPPKRQPPTGSPKGTHKRVKSIPSALARQHGRAVAHPPVLDDTFTTASSSSSSLEPVPTFPTMMSLLPPMTTLTGSRCTCGFRCACRECAEHGRTGLSSEPNKPHRAHTCPSCIDYDGGIELPPPHITGPSISSTRSGGASIIEQFITRAANLPPPPPGRRSSTFLDPMDVSLFPAGFGAVKLPKLECCGGRCGCPDGRCMCGTACDGRCAEHITGMTETRVKRSCCAKP